MLKRNAVALWGDANDGAPQTEPVPEIPMSFKRNQILKDHCDNVLCRAAAQREGWKDHLDDEWLDDIQRVKAFTQFA